jgi:hypothetical protein
VVALLTERSERGVEDALLRSLPACPDSGVVGERSAANDGHGAVGPVVSLVVGHVALLPPAGAFE